MQEPGVSTSQTSDSPPRITLRQFDKVSNPKSIHGIYPYRGKMSAIDAAHVISQLPSDAVLLDPFCGTGTIVYEAQAHGMKAIGVDNNPLACSIAKGKTEPVELDTTLSILNEAVHNAGQQIDVPKMPKSAARYFHPDTAEQIMRLVSLSSDFPSYLLASLYGSICLAARACNGWLWTSTSVGRINEPLRRIDFYATLLRKVRKHIEFTNVGSDATVYCHDTRRIHEIIPDDSIDIVYTSPPYFDALDYTSYYSKIVLEILGLDRTSIREGLIQKFSSYREDMQTALKSINRIVHDESLIIFVVGDRMVRRKLIRGSDFFTEIAPWANPDVVERQYTKTASGLWDTINTTKRKEQILVWDMATGGRKQD
ncbi:MAG: DNA adenine methylase [Candidatus Thorarchaeota archaeon]|jgi:16S rRNA G966 N2-methylase RsmD